VVAFEDLVEFVNRVYVFCKSIPHDKNIALSNCFSSECHIIHMPLYLVIFLRHIVAISIETPLQSFYASNF